MISMLQPGELDCLIGPAVSQVPGVRMTHLAREPMQLVCRCQWVRGDRSLFISASRCRFSRSKAILTMEGEQFSTFG